MSDTLHSIPELDRQGLRKFGITTGLIVAGLFGIFFPWLLEAGFVGWPWILCGLLIVMGLLTPMALGPVYHWWMRFGLMLSRFTTPLIMGLVFFLVVTPIAILMKLLGKDAMRRKLAEDESTYRIESIKTARERIERPY